MRRSQQSRQKHWYFDCQLVSLEEVCETLTGAGKAVDTGNPISPEPRGYGDHLVSKVPDGGNIIQCIELQTQQPTFIISMYMPCKGLHDNVDEFEDNLAQLH